MQELRYLSWTLISVDTDPASGEATLSNPPMLTTVALDKDASLVFQFPAPANQLHISLETTAITAEDRGPGLFRVFTGPTNGEFREVEHPGWEKSIEGMYASFSTQVSRSDVWLKLFFNESPSIVVNRVTFSA